VFQSLSLPPQLFLVRLYKAVGFGGAVRALLGIEDTIQVTLCDQSVSGGDDGQVAHGLGDLHLARRFRPGSDQDMTDTRPFHPGYLMRLAFFNRHMNLVRRIR
jgi:hypothetical protein